MSVKYRPCLEGSEWTSPHRENHKPLHSAHPLARTSGVSSLHHSLNEETHTITGNYASLREVLRKLPETGGKLIDTAPAYGIPESVVGDLVAEIGNRDKLFFATKVGVRNGDRAEIVGQMEESMRRLKTNRIDLMQIWNLIAVPETLPILREWKAAGRS